MAIRKASRQIFFDNAKSANPSLYNRIMRRVNETDPYKCWPTSFAKDKDGISRVMVSQIKRGISWAHI